jgi:hypothetical protein
MLSNGISQSVLNSVMIRRSQSANVHILEEAGLLRKQTWRHVIDKCWSQRGGAVDIITTGHGAGVVSYAHPFLF